MEISSPCCLKPLHHLHYPSNTYNNTKEFIFPIDSCSNINTNSVTLLSNHPPKNSPFQIQQPPTRKKQLISPPSTTNRKKSTTTTTATASDILRLMDILGLSIPITIYTSLIKEITAARDPTGAIELHTHINKSGLRPCLALINRVALMYVSCGLIENARQVFDKMPIKDSNSWAAMIWGYAENDQYEEAIYMFIEMQYHHREYEILDFPISWVLVCVLKSCIQTENLGLGMQIHSWLIKLGLGHSMDLFLSSSLINLYGKFGCLECADFVFDRVSRRNTVTWTSKIVNECREDRFSEVLEDFKEMGREGMKKNGFTFSSVLRACGRIGDNGNCGKQVHADAIKLGFELDDFVHCGLVDMYGKCGLLRDARRVFEVIGENRNAAGWNAMLNNYIQHGFCIEAIKFLYQMKAEGLEPEESLLNEVRLSCGSKSFESTREGLCT